MKMLIHLPCNDQTYYVYMYSVQVALSPPLFFFAKRTQRDARMDRRKHKKVFRPSCCIREKYGAELETRLVYKQHM